MVAAIPWIELSPTNHIVAAVKFKYFSVLKQFYEYYKKKRYS
jgi:hypothetical protein